MIAMYMWIHEDHVNKEGKGHMIESYLLEQLVAVDTCGTLSAASEHLHLTQPTVTRSMQKLETLIGVSLFDRRKNRTVLNENGKLAAECARQILDAQSAMVDRVRALDRSHHTITIGAISPGPIMELSPLLAARFPNHAVFTEIKPEDVLLQSLRIGLYQMVFLNRHLEDPSLFSVPGTKEHLYAVLPKGHQLADRRTVTFSDLNGERFLLFSSVGIWEDIVRREMPRSRFLVQSDVESLMDIIESSDIAAFSTDIAMRTSTPSGTRVYIPFSDACAVQSYFCYCRAVDEQKYRPWLQMLGHLAGAAPSSD